MARLASDVTAGGPIVLNSYTHRNGLPADDVKALLETSKGLIWVGTAGGLALFARNPDGRWLAIRSYTAPHGLIDANINSLAEDPHGNVWVGTDRGGAFKIPANGFVSYGSEDGFKSTHVTGMFEDRDGRLCIATRAPGRLFLNRFDGRRFTPVSLNVPARFYGTEWLGWYQVVLESRRRQWWAASVDGLLRFAGTGAGGNPRRMTLARRYDVRDGLAYNHVHQVFEDSGGRIWISLRGSGGNAIMRWDPDTESFRRFSETDGLPDLKISRANGFFEDRTGQIWIGLHRLGVIRYKQGRFDVFRESDGVPAGGIRRFHQDRDGRLWMGSGQGGIARIDHPDAARPVFVRYGISQGLSGNEIQAITEDQWGRIYIGTGHGVDRLDPVSGHVRWYTTADGLAPGEIQTAIRDRNGVLWFGTVSGVSTSFPNRMIR